MSNLTHFFRELRRELAQYDDKKDPAYVQAVKEVAREVRIKVLNYVMVRRTRREIADYFADDMANQGLFFPEIADPERIIYRFDPDTEYAFNETIERLQAFRYARYMPRLYLRQQVSAFEAQSQRNVGGFMKGLLVKRLESSLFAFWKTLERFIASYDRFIQMLDEGQVYISQTVDVYDLLERDDEAEIERLLAEDELDVFTATAFEPTFREALIADRTLLKEVQQLWRNVKRDPKREEFIRQLRSQPVLKGQKGIIFTESAETAVYLYNQLNRYFPGEVLYFTSKGGSHNGETMGREAARQLVEANFDPRHARPRDDVRLLITTDVLAEGINLHRSNVVINYDLPWNPTRVLQRVGRVNRVGTAHDTVYVFNFFPTSQSDEHLGLEGNIIAKIQAFHDMLGEDARYLSEDEEVSQHNLRGQVLYRQLTSRETFAGDGAEEESDLGYLQVIRDVRDQQPDLFERIKRLPKKARAGRMDDDGLEQLVTFFRRGRLKKFFVATDEGAEEVDFFRAVDRLQCEPETAVIPIPPAYYELLAQNKAAFVATLEGERAPKQVGGGHTHDKKVLVNIRAALTDNAQLTDEDEAFLRQAKQAYEDGRFPHKTNQRIMKRIKKAGKRLNGRKIVSILRDELDEGVLFAEPETAVFPDAPREIVLSGYTSPIANKSKQQQAST